MDRTTIEPTLRLYLRDEPCFETDATILAVREDELACDRTCFYPGGGGQPPDEGTAVLASGEELAIAGARLADDGVVWHRASSSIPPAVGTPVRLRVDAERRLALARYHTVLHVLNTIALRDHDGWITGAQIAVDYARIDFKLEGLSRARCDALEAKVNAVLAARHPLRSYELPEEEFRRRDDLLRTLEAKPPVWEGRVRVVEIVGFDAQACGGTHVETTAEVGRFTIFRTENKGRINKRLYVRLDPKPS